MNAKLFINYRREDTAPYAGRLYDRLTAHFGEDQVFIDIDQIEPGEDFIEAINRKVSTCDIAIVAIGPHWLGATDASGKRRLDDEEDFVRMEIVAALQRKIRVIPVLVGGAGMPRKQDLPEALAPLSRRNAIELSETRFHADVNRLIAAIEKSFAVAEKEAELSATLTAPPPEPPAVRPPEPESKDLPEPSGSTKPAEYLAQVARKIVGGPEVSSASVAEREAREKAEAEAARFAEEKRQAAQLAELKLAEEKTAAEAAARLADEKCEVEEAARAAADKLLAREESTPSKPAVPEAPQETDADATSEGAPLFDNAVDTAGYYEKLPDQGDAAAQFRLALNYETGEGVTKDLGKAAELYQKAAHQGYARAQNNLGELYEHGQGVTKDLGKAAELYQKAAHQRYADAQNNLGWLYERGMGVPKDFGRARELYQKAANQGNEQASVRLAFCTENA